MPTSTSLSDYPNERAAFDAAVLHGGLTLTFPTPGKAMYFRARAQTFKRLYRQSQLKANPGIPEHAISSPYDNYVVRYNDREKGEDGRPSSCVVRLEDRTATFPAAVTGPDGKPVDMFAAPKAAPNVAYDDELKSDLGDLIRDLGLE